MPVGLLDVQLLAGVYAYFVLQDFAAFGFLLLFQDVMMLKLYVQNVNILKQLLRQIVYDIIEEYLTKLIIMVINRIKSILLVKIY